MPDLSAKGNSQIISAVLTPALQLWLRSQAEQIQSLQIKIKAGDRQMLSGYVPAVSVAADHAVYQGLHLGQVEILAENIRVNLGQILRGKPLQLLQPIPIQLQLQMAPQDFANSSGSALMAAAFQDLLLKLMQADEGLVEILAGDNAAGIDLAKLKVLQPQILLGDEQVTLGMHLYGVELERSLPLIIRTGIELASPQQLRFVSPQWLTSLQAKRGLPLADLDGFVIDLGPQVALQEVTLSGQQFKLVGKIIVMPA
jgi:hypothetical protein